jgi:hypothetical protein
MCDSLIAGGKQITDMPYTLERTQMAYECVEMRMPEALVKAL